MNTSQGKRDFAHIVKEKKSCDGEIVLMITYVYGLDVTTRVLIRVRGDVTREAELGERRP